MPTEITEITFRMSSNIFINAGIVGLYKFIQKYRIAYPDKFTSLEFSTLEKNELTIYCDELMNFLEDVYYFMGSLFYDTRSEKQLKEKANFYFTKEPFQGTPFSKIKTYGFSALITKNPPVTAGKGGKKIKFDKLLNEDNEFAIEIAKFLTANDKKLKFYDVIDGCLIEKPKKSNAKREENRGGSSEIFLNAGYTTIPQLLFDEKYLKKGNEYCPIINDRYKKLYPKNTSTSPFLSGLGNFNSHLNSADLKISWKAIYLLRFSVCLSLYSYKNQNNKDEYMICNFFNSNSLKNIATLYEMPLFRQKEELEKTNYNINFKLENFKIQNKSNEETEIDTTKDAVWESEIAFMLLYTFYKKQFQGGLIDENQAKDIKVDPFADNPLDKIPISLITFRADKFASTLRPNFYEEYNNIKYILRLFYELETREEVSVYSIWQGLKLNTPKAQVMKSSRKNFGKGKAVERQIRATVLGKVLKGKTIIHELEKLFFESFKYLMESKTHPGFRSYKKLLAFLLVYEKSTNFGNIKNMNAELQQQAVNLGKSVGFKMLESEGGDKKTSAKNGRKYIIRLHKARTQEQFTEALIGIMKKYSLSNKVIETIDKDNFILMRQYTVIGALNVINGFLSSKNND